MTVAARSAPQATLEAPRATAPRAARSSGIVDESRSCGTPLLQAFLRRAIAGTMMRHLRRREAARGRHLRQLHQQRPGWAFWIGQELEKLGHTAHLHDWEISAGGDIAAWMEERHDHADHILCVISKAYLTKDLIPGGSGSQRSGRLQGSGQTSCCRY